MTATLGPVITELESLTGVETRRIHVDRGYRGHNHRHKFRVWITGQVRRVTRPIRREMKRRAALRDDDYGGRLTTTTLAGWGSLRLR